MPVQILIADHDPLVRATCQRYLSARGCETAVAGDALQCIEQLRKLSPDVLVLDPQLLWGGGISVLSWLKEQAPVKSVLVVLTDGHCNERLSADILPLISRRLERPTGLYEMSHFVDELERCCDGAPAHQSEASDTQFLGSRSWK